MFQRKNFYVGWWLHLFHGKAKPKKQKKIWWIFVDVIPFVWEIESTRSLCRKPEELKRCRIVMHKERNEKKRIYFTIWYVMLSHDLLPSINLLFYVRFLVFPNLVLVLFSVVSCPWNLILFSHVSLSSSYFFILTK